MLLAVIVPCYNEEEVIELTFNEINKVIENLIKKGWIKEESFIVFVDDG